MTQNGKPPTVRRLYWVAALLTPTRRDLQVLTPLRRAVHAVALLAFALGMVGVTGAVLRLLWSAPATAAGVAPLLALLAAARAWRSPP
jgi:hypothetical protein